MFTGRRDYAACGGVIRCRGLRTKSSRLRRSFFIFQVSLEASFMDPFKIKNPANAGLLFVIPTGFKPVTF